MLPTNHVIVPRVGTPQERKIVRRISRAANRRNDLIVLLLCDSVMDSDDEGLESLAWLQASTYWGRAC